MCYSFFMRGLLFYALFLAAAAPAAASGLVDFTKPSKKASVSHPSRPKPWTSYTLHSEDGLSVHLVHVDGGVQRNVCRMNADAVAVSLHEQHLNRPKPAKNFRAEKRGDFYDQREGIVSGGWIAGGLGRKNGGVDLLYVTTSPDLPSDLDQEAGKEARSEKGERPALYSFEEAKAKADETSGPVGRVRMIDGPSLKVDVIRLAGRAAVKNTASASTILFAVEGGVEARVTGPAVVLSGNRMFLTSPGATVHIGTNPGKPAYLLLITPSN